MADFFFFTDLDKLTDQTIDQAFGPILNSADPLFLASEDRFKVTSTHTASSNPFAYAICDSKILVQPYIENGTVNTNYVNIILQPIEQPAGIAPRIKYIIYRGILKNSLTDGTNIISPPTTTFTKFITDESTDLTDSILGIQLYNQTDYNSNDLLDNAFYKSNAINWKVFGGWSIGIFDKDRMGVDIILDSSHYNPTFEIARRSVNYVASPVLSAAANQVDTFTHWTKKEELLNYIDPCAFYGAFFKAGIKARVSSDSIGTDLKPSFQKRKGKEIYRDILEGGVLGTPKTLFFNKNFAYLDLRNELNDSLNFMKNYNTIDSIISVNSVLLSDDNLTTDLQDPSRSPFPAVDYYNRGTWKWPLLRMSKLAASNGIDYNLTPGTINTNKLKISLPIGNTGGLIENSKPLAYVSIGKQISNKEKFFKFTVDEINTERLFTKNSIVVELNNYFDDTSSNKPLISSYIKIKYLKLSPDGGGTRKSEGTVIRPIYYLDNLFLPNTMYVPFTGSDKIKMQVYEDESFVNATEDLNKSYIAKTGIVKDQFDYTFFAFATDVFKDGKGSPSPTFSVSSATSNDEEKFITYIDKILPDNCLRESVLSLSTSPALSVQTLKFTDKPKNFFEGFFSKVPDVNSDFISFSLSTADYQVLKSLIATEGFLTTNKIYLGITQRNDKDTDVTNDKDLDSKNYLSFNLVLRGYKNNSGTIEVHEKITNIKLYGFASSEVVLK